MTHLIFYMVSVCTVFLLEWNRYISFWLLPYNTWAAVGMSSKS